MKIRTLTTTLTITLLIGALTFSTSSHAVTINATKIGPVFTTTPVTEVALQALSGFRGAFTPLNLGLTVGTTLVSYSLSDAINRYRFQSGSSSTLPVPQGWSNADTPPLTVPITYSSTGGTGFSTREEACIASADTTPYFNTPYLSTPTSCVKTANQSGINYGYTAGTIYSSSPIWSACPTGYSNVSNTCVLSTSSTVKWPSDGQPTYYQPTPGANWTAHPRDPDTATITASNTFTRTGTDTYGNPVSESISTNAQGGTDYVRQTQSQNATTGQPMVQRDTITTNQAGDITNTTSNVYNNSTINNVQPSEIATPETATSPSPVSQTSTQNVTLPPVTVTGSSTALDDFPHNAPDFTTTTNRFVTELKAKPVFASVARFQTLLDSGSSCPLILDVEVPMLGHLHTTVICDLFDQVAPVLTAASIAAYGIAAVFIFFMA